MRSKYDDRRLWMNTGAQEKLHNLALEDATVARTKKIYHQAAKDIEARVDSIYEELGTIQEDGRWVFSDLKKPAKRKDITALIKEIEKQGLTDYVPEKLQRRMSVLQVKQLSIWTKLHESGQKSHELVKENLLKTIQNSGKMWENAATAGAESFIGFDRNICGYMMGMNWADGNFSSRLWNATEETWEKVRDELTRALANGQSSEKTKSNLKEILGDYYQKDTGINYAVERIVRTESAKASTQADMARWREMGVTKVQWNASFEKNTCEHCADRDGRVYDLNKILDEPPLHPNCRCYFTAYDEVAAQFPDTTYYKDDDGEYQEIQWAPYHSVINERGELRSSPLRVPNYFWNASPWTQYKAPEIGVTIEGELDGMVVDAVKRTYQSVADQYPEIEQTMQKWFNNRIVLHRGESIFYGNKIIKEYGITEPGKNLIAYTYPDGRKGGNILSQMAKKALTQYKNKKWSTGKNNHEFLHELGHVIYQTIRDRDINPIIMLKKATRAETKQAALDAVGTKISKYGGSSVKEAFAELFARVASQDTSLMDPITARFAIELESALGRKTRRKIDID